MKRMMYALPAALGISIGLFACGGSDPAPLVTPDVQASPNAWSFGVMGDTQWTLATDPAGTNPNGVPVAPTYDHQTVRRFEFVPFWGFMVFLLYRMRRVSCPHCGVKVEAVPWGCGKHQMTTAYVLFLAHWAKKLSWKETALSFRTSWGKVCQSVEVVVAWGLRPMPVSRSPRIVGIAP
jgi:hypothetical protein